MVIDRKSKTLLVNTWEIGNQDFTELIEIIKLCSLTNFIFNGTPEFAPPQGFDNKNFLDFITFLRLKKIDSLFVFGGVEKEYYDEKHRIFMDAMECSHIKVKFFPLFFLREAMHNSIMSRWRGVENNKKPKHIAFILQNRPHTHRCLFMDHMYRRRLENDIMYSWNMLSDKYLPYKYDFKYWKEEKVLYRDDKFNASSPYFTPPEVYFDSLFDIVSESTIECIFITEKTWKPIIFGKPFIVWGAPNFHKILTEYGFRLFDNVIDYSFDKELDPIVRADKILEQLEILKSQSFIELYKKTISVVEHNKKRAIELNRQAGKNFYNITKVNKFFSLVQHKILGKDVI